MTELEKLKKEHEALGERIAKLEAKPEAKPEVPKRCKPTMHQEHYYIDAYGESEGYHNLSSEFDFSNRFRKSLFKSKQDAETAIEGLKAEGVLDDD